MAINKLSKLYPPRNEVEVSINIPPAPRIFNCTCLDWLSISIKCHTACGLERETAITGSSVAAANLAPYASSMFMQARSANEKLKSDALAAK